MLKPSPRLSSEILVFLDFCLPNESFHLQLITKLLSDIYVLSRKQKIIGNLIAKVTPMEVGSDKE